MNAGIFRERRFWWIVAALVVVMEVIMIACRIAVGQSAAEFNAVNDPPLWVKMHHGFWAVPFIVVGLWVRGRGASYGVWSLSAALVLSEVTHHLVVLPVWVGDMGWHWP